MCGVGLEGKDDDSDERQVHLLLALVSRRRTYTHIRALAHTFEGLACLPVSLWRAQLDIRRNSWLRLALSHFAPAGLLKSSLTLPRFKIQALLLRLSSPSHFGFELATKFPRLPFALRSTTFSEFWLRKDKIKGTAERAVGFKKGQIVGIFQNSVRVGTAPRFLSQINQRSGQNAHPFSIQARLFVQTFHSDTLHRKKMVTGTRCGGCVADESRVGLCCRSGRELECERVTALEPTKPTLSETRVSKQSTPHKHGGDLCVPAFELQASSIIPLPFGTCHIRSLPPRHLQWTRCTSSRSWLSHFS